MFKKTVSDETKLKLSLSHIGKKDSEETRKKKSESQKNHKVSDRTIERVRLLNLGKSSAMKGITAENHHSSIKVIQLKDNKIINTYCSIRNAAESLGFSSGTTVTNFCKSGRKLKDGSILEFEDKTYNSVKGYKMTDNHKTKLSKSKKGIPNLKISKKVIQINPEEGKEISIFNSAKEAAEHFGSKSGGSHITQCCRGKRKKAYGFEWRYYGSY